MKTGISSKTQEQEIKEAEIRLAAFIAEHNLPFTAMEHLPNLIKKICPDSKIAEGLACSRTKTSAIVKNVLGRQSFQSTCQELRRMKFSLIVDESTDRSTIKHLCLVVRYVNDNNNIQDIFLGLIKLTGADAVTLYNHVITFFNDNAIPYKDNLIGFASDGANVMFGSKNSLMTLLKRDIPSLFVMKCICHSFHLCASYSCEKLPRFVEDLTRDIYNYFGSSPKRIAEYAEFQTFCGVKIHKILHPSQTRWLSVHSVVCRILEQYSALQLFFTDCVANNDLLSAENILQKLNDPCTKLFLQFLEFSLPFFNTINKEMQSESPKLYNLYNRVTSVLKSIFDCFIKREYLNKTQIENVEYEDPSNYLPIEEIYFGANVTRSLLQLNLTSDQINFFRLRCLNFYKEACSQIVRRFALKENVIKLFNFIDPSIVKGGQINSITQVALLFSNLIKDNYLQALDSEWRLLRNTDEIQSFSDDVIIFWQQV
ncbi:zinc finger BED domain-containing protein 5-like [Diabrotica undecimpunctata]|uniref:zinc finger BED domain-containing protein 5-like n=1 Tax=Diabrotica undecimpunctata TaxID=50387 RepID=UPI003B63E594